jgi:hypothetical protein
VLILGENSITGLRVEILQAALDLAVLAPAGDDQKIRIVGPFCTGSQASLGRTLVEWWPNHSNAPVTCITGTALGLQPWAKVLPNEAKRFNDFLRSHHGNPGALRIAQSGRFALSESVGTDNTP